MKTIVINDTEYTLTKAYKEGAEAFKAGVPWFANPYRMGTNAHDEWGDGHVNESEKED